MEVPAHILFHFECLHLYFRLTFPHLSSLKSEHLRLKLECEKLAQEKTEMQRHYVMVSFLINLSRSRFQIKRGQLNIRDLNPYVQLYFWCVGLDLTLVMKICWFINSFFLIQIQSISLPVLRDVLWVERGDAQTNRDLQKTWRHHSPSSPIPFRRGRASVDQMIICHIVDKSYMYWEISIHTNWAYPLPTQPQISYPHLEHCFSINNKWQLQWNVPSRSPWPSWTRWCRFVSNLVHKVGEGTHFISFWSKKKI